MRRRGSVPRRILRWLALVGAALLLTPSTTSAVMCLPYSNNQGFMPHAPYQQPTTPPCQGGWYQHGNFYVTAFAKTLTSIGSGGCPNLVAIGLTGWNGSGWAQQSGIWAGFGFEVQETIPWYSIVVSTFRHPPLLDCVTFNAV